MKRFLLKLIPFVIFCAVICIGIPIVIDPCNVFHWEKIRDNGVEINKNYVKMKYILSNPEKYDTYMFGSSRVGAIHTNNIENENCYNMTYAMALPKENLANLRTFLESDIVPKKIYLGVDSLSYTEDYSKHYSEEIRCPYEYLKSHPLKFVSLYFNPTNAVKSISVTANYKKEEKLVYNF